MCTVQKNERHRDNEPAERKNSHLPIDSFFKYFLSMLGLIKYSGVHVSWMIFFCMKGQIRDNKISSLSRVEFSEKHVEIYEIVIELAE